MHHFRGEGATSSGGDSSDDSYGQEEVFYDHQADLAAYDRKNRAARAQEGQRASRDDQNSRRLLAAGTMQRGAGVGGVGSTGKTAKARGSTPAMGAASKLSTSNVAEISHSPQPTIRARVKRYAGLANVSVATMDHAVSVPSALRGAARRTMFDVLVDMAQRKKTHEATGTTQEKIGANAVISGVEESPSKRTAVAAGPNIRDQKYQLLFPSSASAAVTGKERQPPGVSASSSSSEKLSSADGASHEKAPASMQGTKSSGGVGVGRSGSGSTTTLATTFDESQQTKTAVRSNRRGVTGAPSNAAAAAAASVSTSAPEKKNLMRTTTTRSDSAEEKARADGPDRRLRHLIPAHLRGDHYTPSEEDNDNTVGAVRGGGANSGTSRKLHVGRRASLDDSLSDISSVSSDDKPKAPKKLGDRRSSTKQRSEAGGGREEKDACLLDFLDGVDGGDPARPAPITSPAKPAARAKLSDHWMQQLEERGSRAHDWWRADGTSAPPSAADHGLLEEVLMGTAVMNRAGKPRHRSSSSSSPSASDSSSETSQRAATHRSTSASRSRRSDSSSRSTANSTTAAAASSVDLLRDIDDDVPPWVRRHQQAQEQAHLFSTSAAAAPGAWSASASLAREQAEEMRSFVGKPATFYPSCAATRKASTSYFAEGGGGDGSGTSRLHRYGDPTSNANSTGRFSNFLSTATTAAAAFMSTWKEGKRLLKQNPTAVAVVEYLWTRFQRWRPCAGQRRGEVVDAPPQNTEASNRVAPDPPGRQHDETHSADERVTTAAADDGKETRHAPQHLCKDGGADIKICVQYVEAAFNVAVVHGTLVWCSDDARQRLGHRLTNFPNAPTDNFDFNAVHSFSTAAQASAPWTFLFPEPALMQLRVGVGEHLYLAEPYYVYPDEGLVVASYTFTSDAVVCQQEAQYQLEVEEHQQASHQRKGQSDRLQGDYQSTTAVGVTGLDSLRHRGVSPVRTSAHLALSPAGRSPTDLGRPSGLTHTPTPTPTLTPTVPATVYETATPQRPSASVDRSPHRMVYEIPGHPTAARPSALTRGSAELQTPERLRGASSIVDASPEPHPPPPSLPPAPLTAAALSGAAIKQEMLHYQQQRPHNLGDDDDRRHHPVDVGDGEAPTPSYVRASTVSVNSFSADGFYDPLAMPALPTAGGFTMVLTNTSSADGEGSEESVTVVGRAYPIGRETKVFAKEVDGVPASTDRSLHSSVGDSREANLRIPPPLSTLSHAPAGGVASHQKSSAAEAGDVLAAEGNPPVLARTFGSAEAAVEDALGHGFPRGPSLDWEVPVEVLLALSSGGGANSFATAASRISAAGQDQSQDVMRSRSTGDNGGLPKSRSTARPPRQHYSQSSAGAEASVSRKRTRERSPSVGDVGDSASHVYTQQTAVLPSQLSETTTVQPTQSLFHNVSCSFPTPQPSLSEDEFEMNARTVRAERAASSSCSISSPSDSSDGEKEGKAEAKEQQTNNKNRSTPAFPYQQSHDRRRSARMGLSQPQKRPEDAWRRQLWKPSLGSVDSAELTRFPVQTESQTRARMSGVAPGTETKSSGRAPERSGTAASAQTSLDQPSREDRIALSPSGVYNSLVRPHAEVEESTTTTNGFFALDDVVLSDTEE